MPPPLGRDPADIGLPHGGVARVVGLGEEGGEKMIPEWIKLVLLVVFTFAAGWCMREIKFRADKIKRGEK